MMKIYDYNTVPLSELLIRTVERSGVSDAVRDILADVEARGDEALFEYSRRFDGAELDCLEVSRQEIDAAYNAMDPEFIAVLERAAKHLDLPVDSGWERDSELIEWLSSLGNRQ